jgi:hypothetical protein
MARFKIGAFSVPSRVPIPTSKKCKSADAAFTERSDLGPRIAIYLQKNAGIAGEALAFGTALPCTWKDPATREQTDWYKFQEAVKSHLDECWDVLMKRLPDLMN